jgi:hypothetical protein
VSASGSVRFVFIEQLVDPTTRRLATVLANRPAHSGQEPQLGVDRLRSRPTATRPLGFVRICTCCTHGELSFRSRRQRVHHGRRILGEAIAQLGGTKLSFMLAGTAFTVVITIPALVREIRLARRSDRPPAVLVPSAERPQPS